MEWRTGKSSSSSTVNIDQLNRVCRPCNGLGIQYNQKTGQQEYCRQCGGSGHYQRHDREYPYITCAKDYLNRSLH